MTNITQEKTILAHKKLQIENEIFSNLKKLLTGVISRLYDDVTSSKKLETTYALIYHKI